MFVSEIKFRKYLLTKRLWKKSENCFWAVRWKISYFWIKLFVSYCYVLLFSFQLSRNSMTFLFAFLSLFQLSFYQRNDTIYLKDFFKEKCHIPRSVAGKWVRWKTGKENNELLLSYIQCWEWAQVLGCSWCVFCSPFEFDYLKVITWPKGPELFYVIDSPVSINFTLESII